MAPATTTNGKPKRKRQRRRRQQQSDSSSDSSSSSSSSEDSASEDDAPAAPAKVPTRVATPADDASSDSSDDSSSSSSDSSSESDLSDIDMTGGRRRGRGSRRKAAATEPPTAQQAGTQGTAAEVRRPYPERSPSPQRIDPAHVPLGSSLFPLLRPLTEGQPILQGRVPGDEGYKAGDDQTEEEKNLVSDAHKAKLERESARAQRFGEWWRARLVSEFEGDLGGLAAEPGLTPSRLELLLSSLTTLSALHTTSSTAAAESRSIWLHDPSAPIDPLAAVAATDDTEGAEEWGKTPIGGQGDVEVGDEGVEMDEKRVKKGKSSRRKSKGNKDDDAAMEVDE